MVFLKSAFFVQALTRLVWLVSGKRVFVEAYYELRTIFFAHMYELHETAVDDLENRYSYLITLSNLDNEVLLAWKKNFPKYSAVISFAMPILILMGKVTSKDFTLVSQQLDENGDLVERNFSEGGIFNDIGNNPKRKIDAILKYFQIERLFQKSNQNDLEWFVCKFKAERKHGETVLKN